MIISGEKVQEICDVYCGREEDLNYNPNMHNNPKCFRIDTLNTMWNNPSLIFCYGNALSIFKEKMSFIQNKFVLVSHNADYHVTDKFINILDSDLLIAWFAENLSVEHPKIHFLPIGIANSKWEHGNMNELELVQKETLNREKDLNFYFHFSLHTNQNKRNTCKTALEKKGLKFDRKLGYLEYLRHLSKHKFSICPEGNGLDCHRTWESYYVGVIPILLDCKFSQIIKSILPCILLKSWDDFNEDECLSQYENLSKELKIKEDALYLPYYFSKIKSTLSIQASLAMNH